MPAVDANIRRIYRSIPIWMYLMSEIMYKPHRNQLQIHRIVESHRMIHTLFVVLSRLIELELIEYIYLISIVYIACHCPHFLAQTVPDCHRLIDSN